MDKKLLVEGAELACDKGSKTGDLTITEACLTQKDLPIARATDFEPGENIPSFGECSLTQTTCAPDTCSDWINSFPNILLDGEPAITTDSALICNHGGIITPLTSGQENLDPMLQQFLDMLYYLGLLYGPFSFDPVSLATGNFVMLKNDLSIQGACPLSFTRTYNSIDHRVSHMGAGWVHNLNVNLDIRAEELILTNQDGRLDKFTSNSSGQYVSGGRIITQIGNQYILSLKNQSKYIFDLHGRHVQYIDRHQNITYYEYNGSLLSNVTNKCGTLYLDYNNQGFVTKVTDHTGRYTKYRYDDNGHLVETKDVLGTCWQYKYNADGLLIEEIDPNGDSVLQNTYDRDRRCIKQVLGDGTTMGYAYYPSERKTILSERNGSRIRYYFDEQYHVIKTVYADGKEEQVYDSTGRRVSSFDKAGNETKYTYDGHGNIIVTTDALGRNTLMDYDKHDHLVKITKPDGTSFIYEYNMQGIPTKLISPDGGTIRLEYTDTGRLCRYTRQDGSTVFCEYDAKGNLVKLINPIGQGLEYGYDDLNQITSIRYADGGTITCRYNLDGKIAEYIDATGCITTYEYNDLSKLVAAKPSSGSNSYYTYDIMGRLTEITNIYGGIHTFEYNVMGKLTKALSPDQSAHCYEYNKLSQRIKELDVAGNVLVFYEYNPIGLVSRMTNAQGAFVDFEYDAAKRLVVLRDAASHLIRYTYDLNDRITCVEDENGRVLTTYEYDSRGNMVSLGTPEQTIQLRYDNLGNTVSVTDPYGNEENNVYDCLGRVTQYSDKLGNKTQYKYDCHGKVIAMVNALGEKTNFEYDLASRLTCITNALGHSTKFAYDENGVFKSVTNPLGNHLSTLYTPEQNLSEVYDGNQRPVRQTVRNNAGKIESIIDAVGGRTAMSYDNMGNLASIVDAMGNKTIQEYDIFGNLVARTKANGVSELFEYDKNTLLTQAHDTEGNAVNNTYNTDALLLFEETAFGRKMKLEYNDRSELIDVIYGNGNKIEMSYDNAGAMIECGGISYSYDANGNLLTSETQHGVTRRRYDQLSRIISYTNMFGDEIRYQYDRAGNLAAITYPDGKTVRYNYDAANQLTAVIDYRGRTTRYTYDDNNRIIKRTCANGITEQNDYDDTGRLISRTLKLSGKLLASFSYVYDLNGNLIGETRDGKETQYRYDCINQIISANREGETLTFNYRKGNIAEVHSGDDTTQLHYGWGNKLLGINGNGVEYDENGNVTAAYLSGKARQLAYDKFGQLIAVDGTQYIYDGDGQRSLIKTGNCETRHCIAPMGSRSQLLIEQAWDCSQTIYVYGNELISQECIKDGQSAYSVFHFDHRGCTIAMSDESGEITDSFSYDIFGSETRNTGTTNTRFKFIGQYGVQTEDNGLVFMRNRYYAPELMRFLQPDPRKITLNWYTYCRNNPLIFIDPDGLEDIVVIGGYAGQSTVTGKVYDHQREFVDTGLKQATDLSKDSDNVTLMVPEGLGYTDRDMKAINDYCKQHGINVDSYNSAADLIAYLNTKRNGSRSDDLITSFFVFAHGHPSIVNFAYSLSKYLGIPEKTENEYNLTIDMLDKLNEEAFDNAYSHFYSCRTAQPSEGMFSLSPSFAQIWSKISGGVTFAAYQRTNYTGINATTIWDFITRGKEMYKKERREFADKYFTDAEKAADENYMYKVPYPSYRYPEVVSYSGPWKVYNDGRELID